MLLSLGLREGLHLSATLLAPCNLCSSALDSPRHPLQARDAPTTLPVPPIAIAATGGRIARAEGRPACETSCRFLDEALIHKSAISPLDLGAVFIGRCYGGNPFAFVALPYRDNARSSRSMSTLFFNVSSQVCCAPRALRSTSTGRQRVGVRIWAPIEHGGRVQPSMTRPSETSGAIQLPPPAPSCGRGQSRILPTRRHTWSKQSVQRLKGRATVSHSGVEFA